eukprot:9153330-Alexandrium_andersonii.AAC.1
MRPWSQQAHQDVHVQGLEPTEIGGPFSCSSGDRVHCAKRGAPGTHGRNLRTPKFCRFEALNINGLR